MTSPDTSHTPGPWEACDPGDYGDFDGKSRVILGDDRRIAVVHWSPRLNTAQSDANARLIAAAPDLKAAAIQAEWFLAQYADYIATVPVDEIERHPYLPDLQEKLELLRAALAKATPEPHHD